VLSSFSTNFNSENFAIRQSNYEAESRQEKETLQLILKALENEEKVKHEKLREKETKEEIKEEFTLKEEAETSTDTEVTVDFMSGDDDENAVDEGDLTKAEISVESACLFPF